MPSTSPSTTPPFIGQVEDIRWIEPFPGERVAIRIPSAQAGGTYAFFEMIVAPMAGPPMHIHHDADEVFYVLDGKLDIACGDRRSSVGPGGMALVPRGCRHAFRNSGSQPARMLVMLAPGGFEQLMTAIVGREVSELSGLAARFHAEIVGPPLEAPDVAEG